MSSAVEVMRIDIRRKLGATRCKQQAMNFRKSMLPVSVESIQGSKTNAPVVRSLAPRLELSPSVRCFPAFVANISKMIHESLKEIVNNLRGSARLILTKLHRFLALIQPILDLLPMPRHPWAFDAGAGGILGHEAFQPQGKCAREH